MNEIAAGSTLMEKYRLERRLAGGGMGALWLGFDVKLRRRVVVKFLRTFTAADPEMVARFEREARAAARIRSPHVIETYDYGVDGGHAFIVIEYLEGEDLNSRLSRVKKLAPPHAADICKQLGKALDAVHGAGVIHRDLKPGNIFLMTAGGEDFVKLLDFGIAKAAAGACNRITQKGTVLGTPRYMSPEQIKEPTVVDYRTDLWSMAVILYRMLTGHNPFFGASIPALVERICSSSFPKPSMISPELPVAVDEFFERAFAGDPDARYGSGRELTAAFHEVLQQPMSASAPPLPVQRSVGAAPVPEQHTIRGVGPTNTTLRMGAAYFGSDSVAVSAELAPGAPEEAALRHAPPSSSTLDVVGRPGVVAGVVDREAETLSADGRSSWVDARLHGERPAGALIPSQRRPELGLSLARIMGADEEVPRSSPGDHGMPSLGMPVGERVSEVSMGLTLDYQVVPPLRLLKLMIVTLVVLAGVLMAWSRFAHGAPHAPAAPPAAADHPPQR